MSWFAFAGGAIVSFGVWGLLSKLALEHATWAQASLVFGVATVLVSLVAVMASGGAWSTKGVTLGTIAGVAGAVGFLFFYLALDRGPASQVVPVIGIYPVLTAILAVLFLTDRLNGLQTGGVALAIAGVLLVGLGS